MSFVTDQLNRDAQLMKVLPRAAGWGKAYTIDEVEANRISNNLAQAAREIERLEREIGALRYMLEMADGRGQSADSILEDNGIDLKTWERT